MNKHEQQQIEHQNREAASALAPEVREVEAGGKTYRVTRLETRQVWPILRAGLPIFEGLVDALGIGAQAPAGGSPQGSSGPAAGQPLEANALERLLGKEGAAMLTMLADHGERITEIIAVGIDEKISAVGKFEPQETIAILRALFEVNRDFFTHRVAPALGLSVGQPVHGVLAAAVAQAVKATTGDGATPSNS